MSHEKEFTHVIREWSEVFLHRSLVDFKGFMAETGLSFSHINILMRLFHGADTGITEISEHLGVTNAAASQSVERLVQMGLVERAEDPEDRRARRLTLTARGRSLIVRGIEARGRWIEGLTDALTPDQQELIVSALTLLTQAARNTHD